MARSKTGLGDFAQPIRLSLTMAAMVGLLTLTLLGPGMTMLSDSESGAGNTLRQIGYMLVFAVAVVAVRPLHHPERLAVIPWPFLLALSWCWSSLIWALDPAIAFRRLVLTSIIIWSIFGIVRHIGIDRTILFIRCCLVALLVVNYVAVLAYPTIGLHHVDLDGKWRGIMGHKNAAGLACALTIIFFAFDRRKVPHAIAGLVIACSCIFLWFSDSKTSFRLVAISIAIGYAMMKFILPALSRLELTSMHRRFIWVGSAILVIPLVHIGVQSDIFLSYLSDGSGLTGRTTIWAALVRYYLSNPLFGTGYGSFWNIDAQSPILHYGEGWVQTISEGHNGFLDILVTVGLPGLSLIIFATFIFPFARLISTFDRGEPVYGLISAVILFCFAHNASESSLFDRDSLGWVFLLLAISMLWARDHVDLPSTKKTRRRLKSTARIMNDEAAQRAGLPVNGNRRARIQSGSSRADQE